MIKLLASIVGLCFVSTCRCHSVVAEYKHLDNNVMKVLHHPLSEEDWDQMLKTVEYYIMKIVNQGLRISQMVETNKVMVNKILGFGKPKFMNVALNEQELIEEACIPEEKIKEFDDLRKEFDRTWTEFVKIAKAMKWQKRTRKPYIVQGAFHGRRLGRRKGRKEPYPFKKDKTSEIQTNELDLFDTSESEE